MNVFRSLNLILCATLVVGCNLGCNAKDSLTDHDSRSGIEPIVVIDDDASKWGTDPTWIQSAAVSGSELDLSVTYSGGCKDHSFALVASEEFVNNGDIRLSVTLAHEGNDDYCEAALTERVTFELQPIAAHAKSTLGIKSGRIELLLSDNPSDKLWYSFGSGGGRN